MDEQPSPFPSSAGLPKYVEGYWYPIEFPILPFLGLILGAAILIIVVRQRMPKR